jgi:hypothetical protein
MGGLSSSPERDDRIVQHSVLVHLIEHPVHLTEADLIRELASDPEAFGPRDHVQQAICDLAKVGLVHRHGPFVLPTRAALYAANLFEERYYEE